MNLRIIIFNICISMFFISCLNEEVSDKLKGNNLVLPDFIADSIKNEDTSLVYLFDGNCSACVVNLVSWLNEWNKYKSNNIKCFFISNSIDTYKVEYFLNECNTQLKKNQYLISDTNNIIHMNNKALDPYINILLIDCNHKIICSGNPFDSKKAQKTYKDYNLLRN